MTDYEYLEDLGFEIDDATRKYLELRDRYDGPDGIGREYMRGIMGAVDYNPFTARSQGIFLPDDLEKIAEGFKQVERLNHPDAKKAALEALECLIEAAEAK